MFRWLKSLNISVGSGVRQRKLAKEIIGDNVVAELGAFTFKREGGGEEIREVPFVISPTSSGRPLISLKTTPGLG